MHIRVGWHCASYLSHTSGRTPIPTWRDGKVDFQPHRLSKGAEFCDSILIFQGNRNNRYLLKQYNYLMPQYLLIC